MAGTLPGLDDHLATLKASTPARIFLPSAGAALATKANLAFQLAHAQARDAVGDRLDTGALAHLLRARGLEAVCIESAAPNRRAYLMRPDLGRRLAESSHARLLPLVGDFDMVFVVGDGLSARAAAAHAPALIDAALPAFHAAAWKIWPGVTLRLNEASATPAASGCAAHPSKKFALLLSLWRATAAARRCYRASGLVHMGGKRVLAERQERAG